MKRAVALLFCLALAAVTVGAETSASVDIAALLGFSVPGFTASAGMEKATCTANCAPDPYVTCSTASQSSSCTAVDRNCAAGQRGYVVCDGVTKYCASACPNICTPGAYRYLATGQCCDDNTKLKDQQQCVGGTSWQYTGVSVCSGPCLQWQEPIH